MKTCDFCRKKDNPCLPFGKLWLCRFCFANGPKLIGWRAFVKRAKRSTDIKETA
jgi:hypothetical protein